jgi:hypothetical protein
VSALFFTCANKPYQDFAPLYAFSVLAHVPDAAVEIGVEDVNEFRTAHRRSMSVLERTFGVGKFRIREVPWKTPDGKRILPNSVRFVNEPIGRAEYVYIGDIDVIILETDLVEKHLKNMKDTGLPYSNAVRANTTRLSGLHFTRADVHYPLPNIDDLDLNAMNDEMVLYKIVERKGLKIVPDNAYRPVHGIHVSPNREAFVATESAKPRPGWGIERHNAAWAKFSARDDFRRLRSTLSPRIQSCLTTIDEVVESLPVT